MLGIQEAVQAMAHDRQRGKALFKLFRAKAPLFSGGLTNEGIQEVNSFIERELANDIPSIDLTLEPVTEHALSHRRGQIFDKHARDLYHSLGKSALTKMTEYFSIKKDT